MAESTTLVFYCGHEIPAERWRPNQGKLIPFRGPSGPLLTSQYAVDNWVGHPVDPRPDTIGDRLMFVLLFIPAMVFLAVFVAAVHIGGFSFMGTSGKNGGPNLAERMAGAR